jgi:hypothetical protein
LIKFSRILELYIIIFELVTNYPRLIMKLELKLFYNFVLEIKFKFKLWN